MPACATAPQQSPQALHAAAVGTGDRRHLSARDRIRQPLFPGCVAAAIRQYIWFDETRAVTPFGRKNSRACRTLIPLASRREACCAMDLRASQTRLDAGESIWPNGFRYLWTDAFGLVLLVPSTRTSGNAASLTEAERLVAEVDHVLGRPRGIRIGEKPDRDGQYFHYLAMWLYALAVLGRYEAGYRDRGIALACRFMTPLLFPATACGGR